MHSIAEELLNNLARVSRTRPAAALKVSPHSSWSNRANRVNDRINTFGKCRPTKGLEMLIGIGPVGALDDGVDRIVARVEKMAQERYEVNERDSMQKKPAANVGSTNCGLPVLQN